MSRRGRRDGPADRPVGGPADRADGAAAGPEGPEDPEILRSRRRLARAAESDPGRPGFHFRPPAGWMNDPNGILHHRGRYHLFYQHNPFDDAWGRIHWGHARSRDLVEWEPLPVALAPATNRGEAHCFSGCAWPDEAGRPVLLYSSVPAPEGARPFQVRAARGDDRLRTFLRVPENPILDPDRLRPAPDVGGSAGEAPPRFSDDWRDPFVFEAGGRTFLVLGATLPAEGDAPVVPLFEAEDGSLLRWRYRGILHRDEADETAFFECPNVVAVEGRHYLLYSAHRPVEWISGRFDPGTGRFQGEGSGRVDHGPAFYATCPVVGGPPPASVLVGWVGGWTSGRGWNGTLSLPRVLTAGPDGELRQRPHPGLRSLRAGPSGSLPSGTSLSGRRTVPAAPTNQLELRLVLDPAGSGGAGFRLRRAEEGTVLAEVRIRGRSGPVEVEASRFAYGRSPGDAPAAASGREGRGVREVRYRRPGDGPWEVRAYWDRSLLELFLDDGRAVHTEVLDAAGEPLRVEILSGAGTARIDRADVWRLRGIW